MPWPDAVPNLLIGLREGLEAGLVISILLAAVRQTTPDGSRMPTAPIWLGAAVKASGQTAAPLLGAGLGLGAAVALCWLLYRRAIRIDLGQFFSRTAVALIIIAAGIRAYGLGDLQEAGLLPGGHWAAFDLTAHLDTGSWWVSLISGVTELTPKMTVLQVVAWSAYLVAVLWAFGRAGAASPSPVPASSAEPDRGRWARSGAGRPWRTATVLVLAPVSAAAVAIEVLPSAASGATTVVTVTDTACAPEWTSGHTGTQTFQVGNESNRAGEINLIDASAAVVAEIETLGPATTAPMTATLGPGRYPFSCHLSGRPTVTSAPVAVSGPTGDLITTGVAPVTVTELTGPNDHYQAWASAHLTALATRVGKIAADLRFGRLAAARHDWLSAQMAWEELGASYDSFGQLGAAVDGLPDGRAGGVDDPAFTGLHRLEYGLWRGQPAPALLPIAEGLEHAVAAVEANLGSDDLAGDPTNLPLRAHEILEDALRDHLAGTDDLGAGAAYAETYADVQVTRAVLGYLAPLIQARGAALLPVLDGELEALQRALVATRRAYQWRPSSDTPRAERDQVDSTIGALLENLASVPNLLEVPPAP